MSARFSTVAAAACLSLSALAGGFAAPPPVQGSDAAATTPAASASGDAAAKHAKRTACLKDAKTKKLVGAEKASFLKTCMAAP